MKLLITGGAGYIGSVLAARLISAAATSGGAEVAPMTESAPPRPTNAFGAPKLAAGVVLAEHAALHEIPAKLAPRHQGDPALLVASADRIRADLGWHADRDLDVMAADVRAYLLSRSSGRSAQA